MWKTEKILKLLPGLLIPRVSEPLRQGAEGSAAAAENLKGNLAGTMGSENFTSWHQEAARKRATTTEPAWKRKITWEKSKLRVGFGFAPAERQLRSKKFPSMLGQHHENP